MYIEIVSSACGPAVAESPLLSDLLKYSHND